MLVDWQIKRLIKRKHIISPYNEAQLQPNSYDVILSNKIKVLSKSVRDSGKVIDLYTKEDNIWEDVEFDEYILQPNECILASTVECVKLPKNISARLEGKSSLGRWFVCNHETAGYIDAGFEGTITLEIRNDFPLPIKLKAGMPIGQLAFSKTKKCNNGYHGKYLHQIEPTESKYYLNKI